MANPQHIEWLLEGVEAWNARREADDFLPDFSHASLFAAFLNADQLDMEGGNAVSVEEMMSTMGLSDINDPKELLLHHVIFAQETISIGEELISQSPTEASRFRSDSVEPAIEWPGGRIPLANANLSFANFTGSHMSGADLRNANLWNADFRGATLRAAKLNNANLMGVDLTGSVLWDIDFSNADLRGADLTGADLRNAILIEAKFDHANLVGTDLSGAQPWRANLYNTNNTSTEQSQGPQSHISIISSTEDLMKAVRDFEDQHSDNVTFYFRGESKQGWTLKPSVMREGFAPFESDMLLNLIARRPNDFTGRDTALEQWVLAQHHGLRTRFLDLSRNPLVSLFNSCWDELYGCHDGLLHIFAVPQHLIKPFNSDVISVIANFAKLPRDDQNLLLGKREGTDSLYAFRSAGSSAIRIAEGVLFGRRGRGSGTEPYDYAEYHVAMHRLYRLIREEKPFFEERIDVRDLFRIFVVEPQQSAERIRAQSGAFLVSAFHERFERDEILKWNPEIPVYAHYTLSIPSECKPGIMKDLRLLNITHETLFPGLDSSAEAITERYKRGAVN